MSKIGRISSTLFRAVQPIQARRPGNSSPAGHVERGHSIDVGKTSAVNDVLAPNPFKSPGNEMARPRLANRRDVLEIGSVGKIRGLTKHRYGSDLPQHVTSAFDKIESLLKP